ncbi:MAG TPA: cation-translocating P-type ATPase, partial [Caldilineaceae bacterium]|nr:cation-translocating P-type ATPase [Caldilineaceae bacterium]
QADLPLGDRRNMAYMGSTVTYGRGAGLVVATGMETELGRIAGLLQSQEREQTPLQRRLDQAGKWLALGGIATALLVGLAGLWRGQPLVDVFLTGVSVAVAVVPEGLPAVVTITLALGARRMLARQALVRRLPAVETLGSVTVICSDKTGTLTENRMTVTVLDVGGHRLDLDEELTGAGQARFANGAPLSEESTAAHPAIRLLLLGGALCNDAQLVAEQRDTGRRFHAVGDPTEGALVVAAARFGLFKETIEQEMPRLDELPFDSERKRMTTVHQPGALLPFPMGEGERIAFTKGSVDGLLDLAAGVWLDDRVIPLDEAYRRRIEEANRSLAENGMRVLGVAYRPLTADERPVECDLVFVGMVGIMDPPRPEVKEAVARSLEAGIRPIMITGDHPLTALHIARELGIAHPDSQALTGVQVEAMDDAALEAVVNRVSVFARVAPEHKLRIVKALQAKGEIVAMTGDGVNDAPALKQADIGVAMGITGTDVAKESAEMVLQDDNFATIVAAIEEGRTIFDNLRKFIKFSIAGNIGKIAVMLAGVAVGMPTPLLPLQLLWLNLLTDGLLGIGLGLEPPERNIMRRPPFSPQAGLFSQGVGSHIVRMGLVIGAVSFAMALYHWTTGHDDWRTLAFTTLAFAQLWQAAGTRAGAEPIWRVNPLSNRPLLGLMAAVAGLQLAAIYLPWLQLFLATEPLAWGDLLLCVAISALVLVAAELEKAWARSKEQPHPSAMRTPVPIKENA